MDKSSIATLIQEIKSRAQCFNRFTCSFIGRMTNQSAHEMAIEGKNWPNQRVWIEEAPTRVEALIEKERGAVISNGNGSEEMFTFQ